jgi:hypothetical protein
VADAEQDQTTEQTPTYQLADLLLRERGGIVDFVASRRIDGMAWRRIARELYLATDKRIDVAHETLRNWFPVDPRTEAKAS